MNEQMLAGGSSSVVHDLLRGGNHDVVGLVLMLRVNAEHQCVMRRRGVPCLDRHLHGALSLWPKCKAAFDAHLTSATRAAADPAKVARLWMDDTSAHPVAGRFADLAASMLAAAETLWLTSGRSRRTSSGSHAGRRALLLRIAEKFADARRRAAFLVNCCDRVCAVLAEARVIGPLDGALAAVGGESLAGCPTHGAFEAQAEAHADAFRRGDARRTGALVAFARDAEATGSGLDLETASSVMDDFGARWRSVVDAQGGDAFPPSANPLAARTRSAAWRRCCRRRTPASRDRRVCSRAPARPQRRFERVRFLARHWRLMSKRRARTSSGDETPAVQNPERRHVLKVL